jgi:alpha-amylase
MPTAVKDLDLSPLPGKTYFTTEREWREDFIYFLMVDRFHDDKPRKPVRASARSLGYPTTDGFYGGNIKGITRNLDYIGGLGCTAIWLSPVFVTNAYHGYDIRNYLDIDEHFGSRQDLIDLVDAAHRRDMRIILDVVINHSGDNWEYLGGPKEYNGTQFPFGEFRPGRKPIPEELQNPDFYHRRGSIRGGHFDDFPEYQMGDLFGLKDFASDDDAIGAAVIDTLIKAHCYWIREADVDGFRVDAVKHMGEKACAVFCSSVREYAYSLGKRGFFLFGEVASPSDDIYDRYIGQNTSRQDGNNTVFFGIDSLLDFRLAEGAGDGAEPLHDVIKGFKPPQALFSRLEAQRHRALSRGDLGRYLITFVDNHDSGWQPAGRFGSQAPEAQIIAGIGYLLCTLGTPCIYYGTEQGFQGRGGDIAMREGMFDRDSPDMNLLNTDCTIYKEIAAIARVMRNNPCLRFGRMYFRQTAAAADGAVNFALPAGTDYTLACSRILFGREVLVAYNVSTSKVRRDFVIVDAAIQKDRDEMKYLYGKIGSQPVLKRPDPNDPTRFVQLELQPMQFVILE